MRCEIAVDIDTCPDHVWAVLTDVTRWPRWTTAVRDARLVGGGALALHGVVRLRAPRLPERLRQERQRVADALAATATPRTAANA